LADHQQLRFGRDQVTHAPECPSHCVTIAGRGRRARSAFVLYRWWLVVAYQLMRADQVDLRGGIPAGIGRPLGRPGVGWLGAASRLGHCLTIPASCASSPAWVRLAQPSLPSMRDTYPLTVASDRYSRLAIWALDSPSPRQPSTSASRSVSVPTSLR